MYSSLFLFQSFLSIHIYSVLGLSSLYNCYVSASGGLAFDGIQRCDKVWGVWGMAVHNWIRHFNCFEERLCGSGCSYLSFTSFLSFCLSLTSVFLLPVAVQGYCCTWLHFFVRARTRAHTHTHTHTHTLSLCLWTSVQPDVEIPDSSKHSEDSNPRFQQASGRRPTS
jgi:hypothetical protein